MKKGTFLLSITVMLLLTITGCKKYEEGPAISLRSKAERVANNWRLGQAIEDGKDVSSDYEQYELSLTKSGGASLTANYVIFGSDYSYQTDGSWAFVSSKEKISFDFDNDNGDGVYEILKLSEDEIWLKEDGGSLELHYVTK